MTPTTRFSRSQLGSFYRSQLGVRGRLPFRIIVARLGTLRGVDAIDTTLFHDLAELIDAPLYYDDDWLAVSRQEEDAKPNAFHNAVFLIGGQSPFSNKFFKNYEYATGSNPFLRGQETRDRGILNYQNGVLEINSDISDSGEDFCDREAFYETNYSPENFALVKQDEFDTAYAEVRETDNEWSNARVTFFLIPGERPEQSISVRIHTYKQVFRPYENTVNVGPQFITWGGETIWVSSGTITTQRSGHVYSGPWTPLDKTFETFGCRPKQPEDGVLLDYRIKEYEGSPSFSPNIIDWQVVSDVRHYLEGVDASNDSLEASVNLIEDMVAEYSPDPKHLGWKYAGITEADLKSLRQAIARLS